MDQLAILHCVTERWAPGIGDPGVMGWATVAAYAVAAVLALRRASGPVAGPAERRFWAVAMAGLAFLAVNKQLDLQSLLTAAGRCTAQLQGWYDMRRTVQLDFIVTLAAAALLGGLVTLWLMRGTLARTWLAILGLVWIIGFVLVRAVGFHHVDEMIGLRVAGMRLNWVFELGGIGLFALGTMLAGRSPRRTAES